MFSWEKLSDNGNDFSVYLKKFYFKKGSIYVIELVKCLFQFFDQKENANYMVKISGVIN